MTSKQQQNQNNSSDDQRTTDVRLSKQYPLNYPPSAQEPPEANNELSEFNQELEDYLYARSEANGALKKTVGDSRHNNKSSAVSQENKTEKWVATQQELWKSEFEHQIPDDELPF